MLQNKNAIITGARRGIGRATVEVFAKNGSNVWACARKYDEQFELDMKGLADKYHVEIWPVYFDLGNEEEIKNAVHTIHRMKKQIDILVNIAGIVEQSTLFTMTNIEKMKQVFDVNFWGVTILTQYVARLMMRAKSGNIIQISSVAGIEGEPAQYEYASSKAAINGAVRQMARELWGYGIRVNAVAPGIVKTTMGDKIEEELRETVLNRVIMKREGKPEEIANVIAFLASDASSYMTGQIIRVDGGM